MKIKLPLIAVSLATASFVTAGDALASSTGPLSSARAVQDDDDEEEKPDNRPEIEALIEELEDHVKEKGDEDAEAVAVIEKLTKEFPESGKRDRKDIVKELSDCLKARRRPNRDGLMNTVLHEAAAKALGEMGPNSVKDLQRWIDHKSFEDKNPVRVQLILSLGRTKDEDGVDTLVDLLPNHDAEIQAATANALSNFIHLDERDRKKIFKEVLDEITRVKNIIDVDNVDPIERKRYDVIAAPMIRTLQELSGNFDVRDPLKFRSWWNDNKHEDWPSRTKDEEGDGKG